MSKLPLENRIVIAFAYVAVLMILAILVSIVKDNKKLERPGISCCGSDICATQHHHGG